MKKIIMIIIFSNYIFAGGSGVTAGGGNWDDRTIIDIHMEMPNDIELRNLKLDIGDFVFDKKNEAFVVKTNKRKVLVENEETANKFENAKDELQQKMRYIKKLEKALLKVDHKPYEAIDFK